MIAAAQEPSCKTCRYFDQMRVRNSGKWGRCLRNPPQFVQEGALNGEWPVVKDDNWCGEHAEHQDHAGE